MTNLLTILRDFNIKPYTHLLPSLERALISTADLLTLDALDVAKRAQLPPAEVKRLCDALLEALQADLIVANRNGTQDNTTAGLENGGPGVQHSTYISTLDDALDEALGGGIATGYLTEVVGESAVGKSQFLLTLLLSVQLSHTSGNSKSALYISTEGPLQTVRLAQILENHPKIIEIPAAQRPSMSRVQSTHTNDVDAQEHILRYQVPVAIKQQNIGLLVIDSIAANYRAEFHRSKERRAAESFAKRNNQLAELGALLRGIAQTHNIAVVVANQVADRFTPAEITLQPPIYSQGTQQLHRDSPPDMPSISTIPTLHGMPEATQLASQSLSTDDPLALDHQQRFFTGWGDDPTATDFKTPSLGLTWTNQLATRIALLKQPVFVQRAYQPGEERELAGWDRSVKVVFSPWCGDSLSRFEIWQGGVRTLGEAGISAE